MYCYDSTFSIII